MAPRYITILVFLGAGSVLFLVWKFAGTSHFQATQPQLEKKKPLPRWNPPEFPQNLENVDQSDPALIAQIRNNWIIPPFKGERNLKMGDRKFYSQRGQDEYIDKMLGGRINGFYIECGAANGEGLSNSLFFEKERHWSGILIEANPGMFADVLDLKRHAYQMNACLSPKTTPAVLEFREAGYIGGLIGFMDQSHKNRIVYEAGKQDAIKIQCFPIFSILKALNITHVDYFSLDIEGAELEILKTFPFDQITVDVLTIEYMIGGNPKVSAEKLAEMKELMIGKYGYKEAPYKGLEDVMFVKNVNV